MRDDAYSMLRLDRDTFAGALRKGHGRVLLHVLSYGLEDVADLVLTACLHTQSYDAQSEPSRADWLFRMFDASPQYGAFGAAILDRLESETDTWDLLQLCELAREMAAHGDDDARRRLWRCVQSKAASPAGDDWMGAEAWIALAGVDGWLDIARIYGRRRLADPEDLVPDHILPATDARRQCIMALQNHASREPEIAAYRDFLESRDALSPSPRVWDKAAAEVALHERVRRDWSVERILDDARARRWDSPHLYSRFGRHATPEELEAIYARLMQEKDDAIRARLLWVFRRAPLRRLADVFIEWADGPNPELRSAAIAALAQVSDSRVHALAVSKAREGKLINEDAEALRLFLNNYTPTADARLIARALTDLRTDDGSAHRLGWGVLDLFERHADAALAPALKWVYEHTPGSICRREAVKHLIALGELDGKMLRECQYDASADVRDAVQRT